MSRPTTTDSSAARVLADVLTPLLDTQTYRNICYLVLSFPLGLAYYSVLIIGFASGIALTVVLVGLGILLGMVLGLRYVAAVERSLANSLLEVNIASPDDVDPDSDDIIATAGASLRAASTWKGFGFVVLKFWVGILSFVLLVTFLGTSIELLLLPVFESGVFNVEVAGLVVAESAQTDTQRLLAVPAGAVLAVVSIHVLNAFARANASIASSLLGPSADTDGDRE